MYVHCHSCGWSQDDFYDKSYNPAKFLAKECDELLYGPKTNKLSEVHRHELVNSTILSPITQQENIARWYEHFGRKIREMKWTTYEQYCNDPNKICPKCGSDKLDLD